MIKLVPNYDRNKRMHIIFYIIQRIRQKINKFGFPKIILQFIILMINPKSKAVALSSIFCVFKRDQLSKYSTFTVKFPLNVSKQRCFSIYSQVQSHCLNTNLKTCACVDENSFSIYQLILKVNIHV